MAKILRRDFFVLPVVFVMTPFILLCMAEAACYYPFYEQPVDSCIVPDPVVGHRAKPRCVATYKVEDSPWIENRYNDCGYRTAESCGPKPAGTIRAAVIGSSIATWSCPSRATVTSCSTRVWMRDTSDCRRRRGSEGSN